jgi:hypothetical protein
MGTRFASGKIAIAICDRCGFRYRLGELRPLVIKTKITNVLVCPECWEDDHPQLLLGTFPVDDPQALQNPRPDSSYRQSGLTSTGTIGEGSRVIQWNWNPVGGAGGVMSGLVPNDLIAVGQIGTVTVVIS